MKLGFSTSFFKSTLKSLSLTSLKVSFQILLSQDAKKWESYDSFQFAPSIFIVVISLGNHLNGDITIPADKSTNNVKLTNNNKKLQIFKLQ